MGWILECQNIQSSQKVNAYALGFNCLKMSCKNHITANDPHLIGESSDTAVK